MMFKRFFNKVAEKKQARDEKRLVNDVVRAAEMESERNTRFAKKFVVGSCVAVLALGTFVGYHYGPDVISYLTGQEQKQEPMWVCDPADDPVNQGNATVGGGRNKKGVLYDSDKYEGKLGDESVHVHSKPMPYAPDPGPAEGTTWKDNVTGEEVHYGGADADPHPPAGEFPKPE